MNRHRTKGFGRRTVAAVVVIGTLAAGSPAAQAQDCVAPSPAADQYCPPTTPPFRDPGTDSGGGLPFTGYDVGLAALAAAGLLGAGAGLRRISTRDEGSS